MDGTKPLAHLAPCAYRSLIQVPGIQCKDAVRRLNMAGIFTPKDLVQKYHQDVQNDCRSFDIAYGRGS